MRWSGERGGPLQTGPGCVFYGKSMDKAPKLQSRRPSAVHDVLSYTMQACMRLSTIPWRGMPDVMDYKLLQVD